MCKSVKSILIIVTPFILFFLNISYAISSDDQYLQELEAEAQASSSINDTMKTEKGQKPLASDQKKSTETLKQQELDFNIKLAKELPASSRTFNKLSSNDKEKVIDAYFKSGKNMSVATRLLFSLYFKSRSDKQY